MNKTTKLTHRADCPTCGREVAVNQSGSLRRHSHKGVRCPLATAQTCLALWAAPPMASTYEDRQRCRAIVAAADLRRAAEIEEEALDQLKQKLNLHKKPDPMDAPATRWERWQGARRNLNFIAFFAVFIALCSHCAH